MYTIDDIQDAIGLLPFAEREALGRWILKIPDEGDFVRESAPAYALPEEHPMTADEYLEFEQKSPTRHEFVDGRAYAMSGASEAHELITGNLFAPIHAQLRGGPCSAFTGNFKLRLEIDGRQFFYYPDIMAACTREGFESLYLRYPVLIVEVLSPSTASIDQREKRLNYTQIRTLEEYLVISQKAREITIHRRSNNWVPERIFGSQANDLELRSIRLSLPIDQLYERVMLQPSP